MQERFYYVRDKEKKPIITVCLLQNRAGAYGRGIAYCHIKDNPFKLRSRQLARAKAARALKAKRSRPGIIHDERTFSRVLGCLRPRKWAPLRGELGISTNPSNVGMIHMYLPNEGGLTSFEYVLFTWKCECGNLNGPPMKACETCGKKPMKARPKM
jgi:hypothetical protein